MSVGTAQSATGIPAESTGDPSMEDILASIRRILSEDETPAAAGPPVTAAPEKFDGGNAATVADDDDVLVLDETMMVKAEPPPPAPSAAAPPPAPPQPVTVPPDPPAPLPVTSLIADETETAAVASVSQMMRSLHIERQIGVYRGGPTLEDMVLEAMRPMLKSWLDQNLPPMVERLVRNEIERVAARALSG